MSESFVGISGNVNPIGSLEASLIPGIWDFLVFLPFPQPPTAVYLYLFSWLSGLLSCLPLFLSCLPIYLFLPHFPPFSPLSPWFLPFCAFHDHFAHSSKWDCSILTDAFLLVNIPHECTPKPDDILVWLSSEKLCQQVMETDTDL